MSKSYTIKTGDTLEIISRREYGTEQEAYRIANANPGLMDLLVVGTKIVIPIKPDYPVNKPQKTQGGVTEPSILINGTRFRFWTEVQITRSVDNIDTVSFLAPNNPDDKNFRRIFRPFSYQQVVVNVGDEVLFHGIMMSVIPTINNTSKTIQIECYSRPGVLNDCAIPADNPVEFKNQTISEIAIELCKPFGIGVVFHVEHGAKFEQETTGRGSNVLSFLVKLAKERNAVISNTKKGELLFQQSVKPGKPVAMLKQGKPPVISVSPTFNEQGYYSHITGIEPARTGAEGSQFTVINSRLNGITRPFVFELNSASGGDVKQAVEAKASRMFANMVSYTLTVPTWLTPDGMLWEPNTTLKLHAHDAMIYSDYEFIIRSVTYNFGNSGELATLDLVLPGAFDGEQPESMPWDG